MNVWDRGRDRGFEIWEYLRCMNVWDVWMFEIEALKYGNIWDVWMFEIEAEIEALKYGNVWDGGMFEIGRRMFEIEGCLSRFFYQLNR